MIEHFFYFVIVENKLLDETIDVVSLDCRFIYLLIYFFLEYSLLKEEELSH